MNVKCIKGSTDLTVCKLLDTYGLNDLLDVYKGNQDWYKSCVRARTHFLASIPPKQPRQRFVWYVGVSEGLTAVASSYTPHFSLVWHVSLLSNNYYPACPLTANSGSKIAMAKITEVPDDELEPVEDAQEEIPTAVGIVFQAISYSIFFCLVCLFPSLSGPSLIPILSLKSPCTRSTLKRYGSVMS